MIDIVEHNIVEERLAILDTHMHKPDAVHHQSRWQSPYRCRESSSPIGLQENRNEASSAPEARHGEMMDQSSSIRNQEESKLSFDSNSGGFQDLQRFGRHQRNRAIN